MPYPIASTRVVRNSGDRKIGPMSATYRQVGPTCPDDCPLAGYGCYAQRGRVNLFQRTTWQVAGDLDSAGGVDLIRHVVSGDWMRPWGDGKRLDLPYFNRVIQWHVTTPRTHGFGYTHAYGKFDAANVGPSTWPKNFRLLASVDDLTQAHAARRAGWQTARVITHLNQRAPREHLCPYDLEKHLKKEPKVTCRTCRLCIDGTAPVAFLKL